MPYATIKRRREPTTRFRMACEAALVGIVVTLLEVLPPSAAAVDKPQAGVVLPDFDVRERLPVRPAVPSVITKALQQRFPAGARAHIDPATGAATMIFAERGALSAPMAGPPEQVARQFLNDHHDLFGLGFRDVTTLTPTQIDRGVGEKLTHVMFQQVVSGIPVLDASVVVNLLESGEVISAVSSAVSSLASSVRPGLSAEVAIQLAASHVRPELVFSPILKRRMNDGAQEAVYDAGPFVRDIRASLVLFPDDGPLRLAWRIELQPAGFPQAYTVVLDAISGELLLRRNNYVYAYGLARAKVVTSGQQVANRTRPDAYPNSPLSGACPAIDNTKPFYKLAPANYPETILQGKGGNAVSVVPGSRPVIATPGGATVSVNQADRRRADDLDAWALGIPPQGDTILIDHGNVSGGVATVSTIEDANFAWGDWVTVYLSAFKDVFFSCQAAPAASGKKNEFTCNTFFGNVSWIGGQVGPTSWRFSYWKAPPQNDNLELKDFYEFNSPASSEIHLLFSVDFLYNFFETLGGRSRRIEANPRVRGPINIQGVNYYENNVALDLSPLPGDPVLKLLLYTAPPAPFDCWAQQLDKDSTDLYMDPVYDFDVIVHEYHHLLARGVSYSGWEARAIHEGGGDFFAYGLNASAGEQAYTANPRLGEWLKPPNGIRQLDKYKTYAHWYCPLGRDCDAYLNSHIWSNTLWQMMERFRTDKPKGNAAESVREMYRRYLHGLNQVTRTTMVGMRDAMLAADLADNPVVPAPPAGQPPSLNYCRMWEEFALRGLGDGAQDTIATGNAASVGARFALPYQTAARPACIPYMCDVDGDRKINNADIQAILKARNTAVAADQIGKDGRDPNRDGRITLDDARLCQLRCDKAGCAP